MPASGSVFGGGTAVTQIGAALAARRMFWVFPQSTSERDAGLSCWTVDLILPLTSQRYTSCIEGAEHAAGLGPVSSPFSAAALDWIHRLDIDLVHVTRKSACTRCPSLHLTPRMLARAGTDTGGAGAQPMAPTPTA